MKKNSRPVQHELITHVFTDGECGGAHSGTVCDNGVHLKNPSSGFVKQGLYESETVSTGFPANELVLTWNGNSPAGSMMSFEFRVGDKEAWSCWYQLGNWKADLKQNRKNEDPNFGPLEVDILKAVSRFDKVEYRVKFHTEDMGQTPALRRIALCLTDNGLPDDGFIGPEDELVAEVKAAPVEESNIFGDDSTFDLEVPWLSQYDEEAIKDKVMIQSGICAATSVTMALHYLRIPARVRDVARRAYDVSAGIYGNWAFLCAAASEYGPDAWVERFSDWKKIKEYIAEGIPPIISISYEKGTFTAEPDKETKGHLIVVRGFADDGGVIVNDPGTLDETRGNGWVYPIEELSEAFFGHGGVAIIIRK